MGQVQTETTAITPRPAMLTDDAYQILSFARSSFEDGFGTAVLTLVEIKGGAARALGAQMAVRDDGMYCGYVSGGCTEAALAAEALISIQKGIDRNVMLGAGSPFFDIVLPCGGSITVTIHVLKDTAAIIAVLNELRARNRVSLLYDPDYQSLSIDNFLKETSWIDGRFARQFRPQVRLIVAGNSLETSVLERLATAAGYLVEVFEPDNDAQSVQIDEDTAVVLLYHDVEREARLLDKALASPSFYIGALGSSRTHWRRCDKLRLRGCDEVHISRLKAPIGLFDKARETSSLAISVLADVALAKQSR